MNVSEVAEVEVETEKKVKRMVKRSIGVVAEARIVVKERMVRMVKNDVAEVRVVQKERRVRMVKNDVVAVSIVQKEKRVRNRQGAVVVVEEMRKRREVKKEIRKEVEAVVEVNQEVEMTSQDLKVKNLFTEVKARAGKISMVNHQDLNWSMLFWIEVVKVTAFPLDNISLFVI